VVRGNLVVYFRIEIVEITRGVWCSVCGLPSAATVAFITNAGGWICYHVQTKCYDDRHEERAS
jgi:hypothetical protein